MQRKKTGKREAQSWRLLQGQSSWQVFTKTENRGLKILTEPLSLSLVMFLVSETRTHETMQQKHDWTKREWRGECKERDTEKTCSRKPVEEIAPSRLPLTTPDRTSHAKEGPCKAVFSSLCHEARPVFLSGSSLFGCLSQEAGTPGFNLPSSLHECFLCNVMEDRGRNR